MPSITTLNQVLSKAEEVAALYEPDLRAHIPEAVIFEAVRAEAYSLPPTELDFVVMRTQEGAPYMFSDWSRSQLLQHLGTREKWFRHVSAEQQASELNIRRTALADYRLRLMKLPATDELRMVRGMVSREYAEISNTDAVKALISAAGNNSACVDLHQYESDRAFYVYALLNDETVRLPETDIQFRVGVVLKNSEVGYSALLLAPFLWRDGMRSTLIPLQHTKYRRIHRGSVTDMQSTFKEAVQNISALWGNYQAGVEALGKVTYATKDECATTLDSVLTKAGSRRALIHRSLELLGKINTPQYTAAHILEAVLNAIEEIMEPDAQHDASAIAGALYVSLQP